MCQCKELPWDSSWEVNTKVDVNTLWMQGLSQRLKLGFPKIRSTLLRGLRNEGQRVLVSVLGSSQGFGLRASLRIRGSAWDITVFVIIGGSGTLQKMTNKSAPYSCACIELHSCQESACFLGSPYSEHEEKG